MLPAQACQTPHLVVPHLLARVYAARRQLHRMQGDGRQQGAGDTRQKGSRGTAKPTLAGKEGLLACRAIGTSHERGEFLTAHLSFHLHGLITPCYSPL